MSRPLQTNCCWYGIIKPWHHFMKERCHQSKMYVGGNNSSAALLACTPITWQQDGLATALLMPRWKLGLWYIAKNIGPPWSPMIDRRLCWWCISSMVLNWIQNLKSNSEIRLPLLLLTSDKLPVHYHSDCAMKNKPMLKWESLVEPEILMPMKPT